MCDVLFMYVILTLILVILRFFGILWFVSYRIVIYCCHILNIILLHCHGTGFLVRPIYKKIVILVYIVYIL